MYQNINFLQRRYAQSHDKNINVYELVKLINCSVLCHSTVYKQRQYNIAKALQLV